MFLDTQVSLAPTHVRIGPLVTLSNFQSLVASSEKWKVKSEKRKVYFLKVYFSKVYFLKVYFPMVYFSKVYLSKVYFCKMYWLTCLLLALQVYSIWITNFTKLWRKKWPKCTNVLGGVLHVKIPIFLKLIKMLGQNGLKMKFGTGKI